MRKHARTHIHTRARAHTHTLATTRLCRRHSNTRYIFGYNEPDHSGSSYLSPAEGAERWVAMETVADTLNLTLVSASLPTPKNARLHAAVFILISLMVLFSCCLPRAYWLFFVTEIPMLVSKLVRWLYSNQLAAQIRC